jgi:two-component system OmpR family sensor kinase
MIQPSLRRQLMIWVLGALSLGAVVLVISAYFLTLHEIDEVLDDSLQQTALLLADRDLEGALPVHPGKSTVPYVSTESMLVAIARRPDGSLLFTSQPEVSLQFEPIPGASLQRANDAQWHVYTVVQPDRVIQVAQPRAARHEVAAESASQLLVPLLILILMIGALLVVALRRGMKPLGVANEALAQRSATSLAPLDVRDVPLEILPLVRTLNDLLQRLAAAFEVQRHFVADAAHELRSPVTALQLQAQILERSVDPLQRAEATAELSAGIARTRRLIEQLLYLSRAAADDNEGVIFVSETVHLGDLARSVVVRWSLEAERRGIDLGADVRAEQDVEGNSAQLERLLSNLVENALRYTPRGGFVDVIAEPFEGSPSFCVIDNGPGISLTERERVFDRFYRSQEGTSYSETGSGLGLTIVKAVADRHGAQVSLHDGRDGVGLQVRVVFGYPRGG